MHLDLAGICASGGSACSTGAVEPSPVLTAMGIPRDLALGPVRFSLGPETTPADIERVADAFPGIVARVRQLSVALGRA
jgi:cysteine desulfurase